VNGCPTNLTFPVGMFTSPVPVLFPFPFEVLKNAMVRTEIQGPYISIQWLQNERKL
jgi:hypothetical protein